MLCGSAGQTEETEVKSDGVAVEEFPFDGVWKLSKREEGDFLKAMGVGMVQRTAFSAMTVTMTCKGTKDTIKIDTVTAGGLKKANWETKWNEKYACKNMNGQDVTKVFVYDA